MTAQENSLLKNIQSTLGSVFETVNFIKDNAVTKEEFNTEINSLKDEIKGIKAVMVTKDYLEDRLDIFKDDIFDAIRQDDRHFLPAL